jgi:phage tail-like protein
MGDETVIPIAYTKISIDTESGGVFTSCSFPAISLTHESIDVFTSEGKGEKLYTNSIMTFGDVTLTRGVTDNKALHDWAFDFAEQGPTGQVKQVTIDACDQSGNPVMTWSLTDAFIKSYDPGQAQAGGSAVLTETIVLGYKEAKRTK